MSERLIDRIPFAKITTVLAVVFGISLGLCGVTAILSSGGNSGSGYLFGFGMLELVALGGSVVGLLLTLLVFVVLSIFGAFRREKSQSIFSSKDGDTTNKDKDE
jgi:hypothetical protein